MPRLLPSPSKIHQPSILPPTPPTKHRGLLPETPTLDGGLQLEPVETGMGQRAFLIRKHPKSSVLKKKQIQG